MGARVETVQKSYTGTLVNAPDIERQHDGRPFLCERFHVCVIADLGAWVWVEGRAVRVDGSIGKANRGEGYDLDNANRQQPAPTWLIEALTKVGVTW